MAVLFTSTRPLGRCENLTAVWDAYDGEKEYRQLGFGDVSESDCDVVVTDEFLEYADKPRQTIVMIAHGLTGGKLYGNDQPHGLFQGKADACALVDWYVTSSEYGRKFAASASGVPLERCLPLGMPRTDAYLGKRKGDGGTVLAGYRRAYLYAPTFRAWYNAKPRPIDWGYLDSLLDDDEIFAVKRHMVAPGPMVKGEHAHIVEVGNGEPSTPYLVDCDVLLTDFSSILFDGYVLGKPSVLVTDGAEAYEKSHGMYNDYPAWYGSRTVEVEGNEDGFLAALRAAYGKGLGPVERNVVDTVAGECDGHASERVAELVRRLAHG